LLNCGQIGFRIHTTDMLGTFDHLRRDEYFIANNLQVDTHPHIVVGIDCWLFVIFSGNWIEVERASSIIGIIVVGISIVGVFATAAKRLRIVDVFIRFWMLEFDGVLGLLLRLRH
jgi:hypothetical protein